MARRIKAVFFDIGGVIIEPPQNSFKQFVNSVGVSSKFLMELFVQGSPENAFCKLEKGQLTLSEFFSEFDSEARKKALDENVNLPKGFTAEGLFSTLDFNHENSGVRYNMLTALTKLRKNGINTCAITNNWVDDRPDKKGETAMIMTYLRVFFDQVVESARVGVRKPDTRIFDYACSKLNVNPKETVFLDDLGVNLKSAKMLGIQCIKVTDPIESLKELERVIGVKLFDNSTFTPSPPPILPSNITHSYVKVSSNIRLHFVEAGVGPVVILLHGFPDTWYGYRHQIPALACAGFRVIAVDQRGYGESSSPNEITEYSQEKLSADIISLMDALVIPEAVVVGHDWGASVAWNVALMYPERVKAVCGINNPFYPINPKRNPLVSLQKRPGVFDYMLYFQEPGVAEKELNESIEKSLLCILRGYKDSKQANDGSLSSHNVRQRGGILKGFSNSLPRSSFLTDKDVEYYTDQFKRNGFEGPLNWYRNLVENWKWRLPVMHRKIVVPALMVTSENDPVLRPEFSYGMEERVPNLQRLHIQDCGHWVLQEKPEEFNNGFIKWLRSVCGKSNL